MATFVFTLDETSVGQMLTPEDGHVTALAMTTPPPLRRPSGTRGVSFGSTDISSFGASTICAI